MKKLISIITLTFILTGISYSQFSFSVKPGLNLNSANIGYRSEKGVFYGGLQFINVIYKYKNGYDDDKLKLHVYMPYIGYKSFIMEKENIKSSISATLFKPMIFGKEITDGTEEDSYREELKDIGIWGGEFAFGTEYFLSENFSLGGEFGLRLAIYVDDHDSGTYTYKESLYLNMTYVSGSLNFYF